MCEAHVTGSTAQHPLLLQSAWLVLKWLFSAGLIWEPVGSACVKRMSLGQLPKTLCLHLRRAYWGSSGRHIKLSGPVHFPLKLDVSPHMAGRRPTLSSMGQHYVPSSAQAAWIGASQSQPSTPCTPASAPHPGSAQSPVSQPSALHLGLAALFRAFQEQQSMSSGHAADGSSLRNAGTTGSPSMSKQVDSQVEVVLDVQGDGPIKLRLTTGKHDKHASAEQGDFQPVKTALSVAPDGHVMLEDEASGSATSSLPTGDLQEGSAPGSTAQPKQNPSLGSASDTVSQRMRSRLGPASQQPAVISRMGHSNHAVNSPRKSSQQLLSPKYPSVSLKPSVSVFSPKQLPRKGTLLSHALSLAETPKGLPRTGTLLSHALSLASSSMLDSDSDDDDLKNIPDATEEVQHALTDPDSHAHGHLSHDPSNSYSKPSQQSQKPERRHDFTSSATHEQTQRSVMQGHQGITMGSAQNPSADKAGLYQLTAAVVHHGASSGSGHYTVYRCVQHSSSQRSGIHDSDESMSQWFSISDEHVRQASVSEVMACEATLLLYSQCQ